MRCASLAIGVTDYADSRYRDSAMRLRFAAEDATAFSRYATLASSVTEDEPQHHLLVDRQAVRASVDAAILSMSAHGPYDLFLVYLSGHGEVGSLESGWFCLADAVPGAPSLNAEYLDQILSRVDAGKVLVFIDCCHAEALTSGLGFFAALHNRDGRLYIASARTHQRAWEHDALRRSVFSDVLLRAVSTDSPIADHSGHVDVESRLFPYVRDQVMLLAAATKRGYEQEPITGGVLASSIRLPTIESRSLGRQLTVAQTVRARLQRLVVVLGVFALVALGALELLIFHIAVSPLGDVVIRPGLPASFGALPLHVGAEIDSGFRLADFNQQNVTMLRRLQAGGIWGFSTHRVEPGLRPWLGAIRPGLRSPVDASTSALATGSVARFDEDEDEPPVTEIVFLARLTGQPMSVLAGNLYPLTLDSPISCTDPVRSTMDFGLISPVSPVFRRDLHWLALTTPRDSRARASRLLQLIQLVAYRQSHRSDVHDSVSELAALGEAISLLTQAEGAREIYDLVSSDLARMTETWCGMSADVVASLFADESGSAEAEERLTVAFSSATTDGVAAQSRHALAAAGLGLLASRRTLHKASLDAISAVLATDNSDLLTISPANALLRAIAAHQQLPESLATRLLRSLQNPDGSDSGALASFEILARNARYTSAADRLTLRSWARKHHDTNRTMSVFHEGIGFLALADGGRPDDVALLEARLSPATLFPPRATSYRGAMVISSTGDTAAVALGRLAQRVSLNDQLAERLRRFAIGRPDAEGREEIIRGLAAQEPVNSSAADLVKMFTRNRHDGELRRLNVEVAVERLLRMTPASRDTVISQTLTLWSAETEPEVRIAIGRLLGSGPFN